MQVRVQFTATYDAVIEVDDDEFKEWKSDNFPGERRTNDMVQEFIEQDLEYHMEDAAQGETPDFELLSVKVER